MAECCCCFFYLKENQQAVLTSMGAKTLVEGPVGCSFFSCLTTSVQVIDNLDLAVNQQVEVINDHDVSRTRYEFGPKLVKLESPYERVATFPTNCKVLDQDDYLVIQDARGYKRTERGPKVYLPRYGDVVESQLQSIQVPVNHYIIMEDANSTTHPIQHLRGPIKFYPEPFQTVVKTSDSKYNDHKKDIPLKSPEGKTTYVPVTTAGSTAVAQADLATGVHSSYYFPCVEITTTRALYLQLGEKNAEGDTVVLVDTPQLYMPKVGEKVLNFVERVVLLNTDFCILKSPKGDVSVMDGKHESDRAFFIKPFYELLTFECENTVSILSTLPTFMPHSFEVRTSDNVILTLVLRVSYQIQNVEAFANHPIDFYAQIKNHVQNKLLGKFSSIKLREFMNTFSLIAQSSIETVSEYFNQYGIEVLDIQILNFQADAATQKLLDTDIETSVAKQNELRTTQNEIAIQTETNRVNRKIKDLEVEMAQKDNEVALEKKQLENTIRIKEYEIEIAEETKRKELLNERRKNDLVEAEFAGRAKGHEFEEFCKGVDSSLSPQQKLEIFSRQLELEQARVIYDRLDGVHMYPPASDKSVYDFGAITAQKAAK